ncbi:2-phosphosulfolactate phosphatase [Metabacillus arenae]|uniref:Probable 2-phosphosulfolactate phosphatase n=1 Tax=Metabacillus arenae TaxID=2771434 RepID=A0A926RVR7_9BACI|nr:2-phosphosulfolactate phosphatase [Metabacillus arenae]MBD1379983.1 2-phosphosulfolactate phosphatase [Metabacillus arenae]
MRIETVSTVEEITTEHVNGRTVIVIDVLRASSTMVTALTSGFDSITPVGTVNEAFALQSKNTVLAGEWHCEKIDGFDYNNSPTVIRKKDHTGKHLVLTTTNGTKAVEKAAKADMLLIGCFLNATACITEALVQNGDITIYCAGSRNEFALEDGLAAGLMVHLAKKQAPSIETCDFSKAMEACFLQLSKGLPDLLFTTTTGKRLTSHNYTDDIKYCGQIDILQIVPIKKENRILSKTNT